MTGSRSIQGGRRSSRASFAYGKLVTIARPSTATPATCSIGGRDGSISVAAASTAATIVVGTPQKNRPSLGETLNRASRIAAHTATSAQVGTISSVGAEPDSQA